MRTARREPTGFAAKAKDLQALRDAVVEASTVSGPLWISYLFVFFYLAIAAGAVTHKDLFFENPVKLPFLNVELPLIAFFVLGPLLFLIVHWYTLLHFALLAGKVGHLHRELEDQVQNEVARDRVRRQLPSNVFVQLLAGPRGVRTGPMGFMLRAIAWISLILGPIALLAFFQLQFLPYHDPAVSWWQRIAVLLDLVLLWVLWPSIAQGRMRYLNWRDFHRTKIVGLGLVSLVPVLLVFTVATFPGEWLNTAAPAMPWVAAEWTPHKLLVAGEFDPIAQRPTSLRSNRLVVAGIDLREQARFDTKEKIESRPTTLLLRKRRLEHAVLFRAYLPKVDFTGAQLQGASLDKAQLQGASLDEAQLRGASLAGAQLQGASLQLADLQNASLDEAQLQGASLDEAQLQGASLVGANIDDGALVRAQLQGASLAYAWLRGASLGQAQLQGASLEEARLQGASLVAAQLQGASLTQAQLQATSLDGASLQGASLYGAQLQGASLIGTQLQGTQLIEADLRGAILYRAQLQGAALYGAQLQGSWLQQASVWRAEAREVRADDAVVIRPDIAPKYQLADCPKDQHCDWSTDVFLTLKRNIETKIPLGDKQVDALAYITILDPNNEVEWKSDIWVILERKSPSLADYDKTFAKILRDTGCNTEGAPHVIRGLLRTLDVRFILDHSKTMLMAAFLDEAHCPGARGLSNEDKTALREIRDRAPSNPAAPTPEAKAAP